MTTKLDFDLLAIDEKYFAQMNGHDDKCESEFIYPPGAYSPCACGERALATLSMEDVVLARRGLASVEEKLRDSKKKTSHLRPLWEAWLECFEYKAGQAELSQHASPTHGVLVSSDVRSDDWSTALREFGADPGRYSLLMSGREVGSVPHSESD